jgi:hypothetical protein
MPQTSLEQYVEALELLGSMLVAHVFTQRRAMR